MNKNLSTIFFVILCAGLQLIQAADENSFRLPSNVIAQRLNNMNKHLAKTTGGLTEEQTRKKLLQLANERNNDKQMTQQEYNRKKQEILKQQAPQVASLEEVQEWLDVFGKIADDARVKQEQQNAPTFEEELAKERAREEKAQKRYDKKARQKERKQADEAAKLAAQTAALNLNNNDNK